MSRLPAAEKLSLAVRKNIRDDWDAKKPELEKELSDVLGVSWTVDISPNAIWPYAAPNSWGSESIGSCLKGYVEGAIKRLRSFVESNGETGLAELNSIASAHVLTMDIDETKEVYSCAAAIADRKLVIVFNPTALGSNIDSAFDGRNLAKALNDAPPAEGADAGLSYAAREGVRTEYEPKIEAVRAKIADLLQRPEIKLDPNFEANYARLGAEAKKGGGVRADWAETLGMLTYYYFEGAEGGLRYQKFGEDEMMREALNEELTTGEIVLRVVDELKSSGSSEAVLEDGKLYLQAKPSTWGSNTSDVCDKLADSL